MKCKSFFLVCFLAYVSVVSVGFLSAETTSEKLDNLTIQLMEISKEFNEISVNSELTLMDLQQRFPRLVRQVEELKIEVNQLRIEASGLTEKSDSLLEKWTNLKNGIDVLSSSVETLGMSLLNLDNSIKKAEFKSNVGLAIGITAALGVIFLFIRSLSPEPETTP